MSNPLNDRKRGLEEEYFRRKEQEAIEKLRAQIAVGQQAKESGASSMQCPRCNGALKEVTVEEVQIDSCGNCGGVWLDAGELERLRTRESGGWLTRLWQGSASE